MATGDRARALAVAIADQGPTRQTGSYLRVIPKWVDQMKRAVDAGDGK